MTLAPSLRALVWFAATIVLAAIEPTSLCNQTEWGICGPRQCQENEIPRCARNDKGYAVNSRNKIFAKNTKQHIREEHEELLAATGLHTGSGFRVFAFRSKTCRRGHRVLGAQRRVC